jgi:acyl-CoA thioesterase-1
MIDEGRRPVVTLLGDSITEGYGLRTEDALPVQLDHELTRIGVTAEVRNAGVSGDTTAQGLARMSRDVAADTDVCVVALGANDLMQALSPQRIEANLVQIVERLEAAGVTIVLAGMRAPPRYGAYAAAFDRVFQGLAARAGIVSYPFLLEGVALDRRYNQPDGIHPNAAGVRIIAAGLAPVVASAIARRKARP